VYWGCTAAIVLITSAIAALNVGFGVVLKVIGSTAGPVICFFFPACLYLKETSTGLRKGKPWIRDAAKALLVLSFITTAMSLVLVIMEIVSRHSK
jgi:amino acid permease